MQGTPKKKMRMAVMMMMMMMVMVVVVIKNLTVNMKNNARGDIGLDFASGTQIPDTTD